MISGAQYLVKALQEEQVEILFNYPGAATIDIMDELYKQDQVKVILPRHEQALAHAADGYARSTGKVGVCMVTSGPGATNLVTGIATAYADSVPLVCITGQVDLGLMGNDAFQEVDTVGIVRNICKYAVTVRDRKDLGRILKEAFYIARTGRPGPVVVDIPKNIQKAMGSDEYPTEVNIRGYKPNMAVHVGQVKKACSIISKAKRPLFLLGGGVSISGANQLMMDLIEKTGIPVVTTLMGKGAVDTRHPLYLGNVGIHGGYAPNVALTDCDVMISIGTRFNDRITGKLSTFAQHCKIIHIDMDAFFAAVEIRDNPKLKGKPVIIGSDPRQTGGRGVVSTCSYEARAFGVHSAMSSKEAYERCPQAVFISGNYEKYKTVGLQIRAIFKRYTDLIEPMSIDEAYLDVTENKLGIKSAVKIARLIQEDIWQELHLTCSAGVSYNKFIAKYW